MGSNELDKTDLLRFDLYRKIRQIIHEIDGFRDQVARNFDLSGSSLYLLISIGNIPECSYKSLAEYTGLAPNTVSSVLTPLITRQLVSCVSDSNDRRMNRLTITRRGQEVTDETWNLIHSSGYQDQNTACSRHFFEQIRDLEENLQSI